MALVTVHYTAFVSVVVDTETRTVTRAMVYGTEDAIDVSDAPDEETGDIAIEIADEATWPTMEQV